MRVELRLAPGGVQSGALRLSNDSAGSLRTRAEILDFYIDAQQTPQFGAGFAQEAEYSCRNWLSLNPMETELTPQGQVIVRYTIKVPQSVSPRSYYCAAGFTSLPPASELNGFGIRTAVQVVAAFYVVIGDPVVQGRLSEIKLERSADPKSSGFQAVAVLENSGMMVFRPLGTLAVLDESGKALESFDFKQMPVLPQRKQRFLFPLKLVSEGQPFKLQVRIDIGTGEIQEGMADVLARPEKP
jgi:hypothetical protein